MTSERYDDFWEATMPKTRSTESKQRRCQRIKEANKVRILRLQQILRDPNASKAAKASAEELLKRAADHSTRKLQILENGAAPPSEEDR